MNYSISEVVQRFSGEFEISESNLRFWEKEGLLAPQRSRGGHRLYSEEDVEKIRLIHKLKTERYFPLAMIKRFFKCGMPVPQIKAHLDKAEEHLLRPLSYDPAFIPCSATELANRTGVSAEMVDRMVGAGLLSSMDGHFDEDDQRIVEMFSLLTEIGFVPEDFSRYMAAVEKLAREQILVMNTKRKIPKNFVHDPRREALLEDLPRYLFRKTLLRVLSQFDKNGFFDEMGKHCQQSNMKGNQS